MNFVPTGAGCELKTSVTAEKSHSHSWFNNGPVITGQVTLLNPKEYGIPVSNVQVTAQSSDGQLYTAYADCGSGSPSTYVPSNPVPYTYGEVSHARGTKSRCMEMRHSALCTALATVLTSQMVCNAAIITCL